MSMLLTSLLDILFPPRPDEMLIRSLTNEAVVHYYQPRMLSPSICALSKYDEPVIQALVREAKFHHNQTAIKLLALLVTTYTTTMPPHTRFIPIPLSRARQRSRGYNQVSAVLDAAAVPMAPLLLRTRNTTPQTSLDRSNRLKNLTGAFAVSPAHHAHISPTTPLIIVDDVTTTGATINEAQKTLAAAGFQNIQALCLAH